MHQVNGHVFGERVLRYYEERAKVCAARSWPDPDPAQEHQETMEKMEMKAAMMKTQSRRVLIQLRWAVGQRACSLTVR